MEGTAFESAWGRREQKRADRGGCAERRALPSVLSAGVSGWTPAGSGAAAQSARCGTICVKGQEQRRTGLQKPNRVSRCVEMFALLFPFSLAGNHAPPVPVPRLPEQT